jgi:hypothetical protein
MKGVDAAARRKRAMELLELVEIAPMASACPTSSRAVSSSAWRWRAR